MHGSVELGGANCLPFDFFLDKISNDISPHKSAQAEYMNAYVTFILMYAPICD